MASGSYSETNVRQEGVDEGDTAKTDGTYLYVAYYESCEVDIMCVSGTDTFKDRFNLYINNAEGTIWGCDIVNIECDIDYRLW